MELDHDCIAEISAFAHKPCTEEDHPTKGKPDATKNDCQKGVKETLVAAGDP
jgi:hypothetical protein